MPLLYKTAVILGAAAENGADCQRQKKTDYQAA